MISLLCDIAYEYGNIAHDGSDNVMRENHGAGTSAEGDTSNNYHGWFHSLPFEYPQSDYLGEWSNFEHNQFWGYLGIYYF